MWGVGPPDGSLTTVPSMCPQDMTFMPMKFIKNIKNMKFSTIQDILGAAHMVLVIYAVI